MKSVNFLKLKMVKESTETYCLNISITILPQVSYDTFATDLKNLLKQVMVRYQFEKISVASFRALASLSFEPCFQFMVLC